MKKKILLVIITIIIGSITLSSCVIFHRHKYEEVVKKATCVEDGEIYQECECGSRKNVEKIEATGHSFGEGTIAKQATCLETGLEIKICSKCNYSEGKTIPIANHKENIVPQVYPTCTKIGSTQGAICEWCERVLWGFTTISNTGHIYVNGICSVCGDTYYSDGLEYTYNKTQGGYYEVSDVGDCTEQYIIIPSIYNNRSVLSIGELAFSAYKFIISVTIPNGIISIGKEAFARCSNLKEVNLPNSISSIGEGAFNDCNIEKIILGKNLKTIGKGVFANCANLKNIEVDENNPYFQSIDGVLYSKDMKVLYAYPIGKKDESFTIPNEVEVIYDEAFKNTSNLKEIIINEGSNLKTIGRLVFFSASNLEVITLENATKLELIGSQAFSCCDSLVEITLPRSNLTLESNIFSFCDNLSSLYIPNTVETIDMGLCAQCDVSKLTIYCENYAKPKGWNSRWHLAEIDYESSQVTVPNNVVWGYYKR